MSYSSILAQSACGLSGKAGFLARISDHVNPSGTDSTMARTSLLNFVRLFLIFCSLIRVGSWRGSRVNCRSSLVTCSLLMVDRAGFEPATLRDFLVLSAMRALGACQADDLVASPRLADAHTRLIYRPTFPSRFRFQPKNLRKNQTQRMVTKTSNREHEK
jgi:hypothetical protein